MSRLDRVLLVGDVLLVGMLITAGEIEVATRSTYEGAQVWPGGAAAGALVPLVVLPLLLRRIRPAIALTSGTTVLVVGELVFGAIQSGVAVVVALVILYSGAAHLPRIWPSLLAGAVVAAVVGSRRGTITGVGDAVWFAGEIGIPIALGRIVSLWREQLATLRHQHAELQRLHAIEVAAAATAERSMIAREVHDVIAHAVSVIVIQAQVGARALPADIDVVADALATVESSGRSALVELRRLLAVLADGDAHGPIPVPEDLDALLTRARAAGVVLSVERDPLPELPEVLRLTVHRVVQEALTNVMKHAPASPTSLRIRCDADRIRLEVVNEMAASPTTVPGAARGLVGMNERIALVGGTFDAGADGRSFRVNVSIPVGATA